MSKFSDFTKKAEADYKKHSNEQIENFMGGISYKTNPLLELEMIAASSIFGERSYYRPSGLEGSSNELSSTTQIFIEACDKALDYDFEETLDLAVRLRKEYLMRLNSALIVVRAVMHKDRVKFNEKYKNFMRECILEIISIPTDIYNQFELWMFFNTTKNKLPSILKRVWAEKLSTTSRYHLNKYKTKARIIDLVRISHAHSKDIDELMKTGTLQVTDEEMTWEKLRSEKMLWIDILRKTYIPHMALLRNLKGIFTEIDNESVMKQILGMLKGGVESGKQFPFRYFTAMKMIKRSDINFKQDVIDSLNYCLDASIKNFPVLKGKTICLSDNSGSAWGAIPSEYGSVTVAEIGNLSSILTAINSDEGEVGVFGDKLEVINISKRDSILSQLEYLHTISNMVGRNTENGIWLFFDEAIRKCFHYDNIFIYSDMQAGHGGLYGLHCYEYRDYIINGNYIDVFKLVKEYRKRVNPKVNIFSIQTAGYDNNILPENEYRTSILTGWTGKEAMYANEMISIWNKMENIHSAKNADEEIQIKIKK